MAKVEQIQEALRIIKEVEEAERIKILVPKGEKFCRELISRNERQIKTKKIINDSIEEIVDKKFKELLVELRKDAKPVVAKEVKVEQPIELLKPKWRILAGSDEVMVYSNGKHKINVFLDQDTLQRVANIDGGESIPIEEEEDLLKVKEMADKL